jgi:hypothetical protein
MVSNPYLRADPAAHTICGRTRYSPEPVAAAGMHKPSVPERCPDPYGQTMMMMQVARRSASPSLKT